jgi:hypothetical protein
MQKCCPFSLKCGFKNKSREIQHRDPGEGSGKNVVFDSQASTYPMVEVKVDRLKMQSTNRYKNFNKY